MRRRSLGGRFGRGRSVAVSVLTEHLEVRSLLSGVGGSLGGPGDSLADHLPGEILVKFSPGTSIADAAAVRAAVGGDLLETLNTPLMKSSGSGWLERISFSPGFSIQQAMQIAQTSSFVQFAEPNYIYQPAVVSNDTEYLNRNLWGTYSSDTPVVVGPAGTTNIYGSQAEQIWNLDITGSHSVIIGVIDEGIQDSHPDLAGNIWVNPFETPGNGIDDDNNGYIDDVNGWDFYNDDNSVYDGPGDDHGTHCAGTIGAVGGNGQGIAGVSWSVTMISCKFLQGSGSTADAIMAVDYLTDLKRRHGLNIVASSNSWGGGGYSQGLHEAIIRNAKTNTLFIAAAGNNGRSNDSTANYPSNYNTTVATPGESAAAFDSVIAVAAIDSAGGLAGFSNFGPVNVDIGAPGVGIVSTVPVNGYANYQGTSMATPHVSGAVALYASLQPQGFPAEDIRRALLTSATPTGSLAGRTVTGARLNVADMILQKLVTVDTSSLSDTTESGGQTSFTVRLAVPPSADVTIPISSAD
ncbi:MAG: hypothetical protein RLZZ458_36, partial [Planctomycetota bacterium]